MAVSIRFAVAEDREACIELLEELAGTSRESLSVNVGEAFDQLLTRERGEIFLAVEDQEFLGMATVSYNLAMRYGGEYCQLEELIVDPAARGKKIGALLMEAVVARARERGCGEFGLYLVESTEHNRPFYEKFGFVAVGTEMRQRLD
jgi:GNAT superfamily N-acetyltransferase